MTRYTRELRFRFKGDVALCQRYIPQARVVVGKLLDTLALGATTGAMTRQLAPGVTVRASVWDGEPIAEIDVTGLSSAQQVGNTEFNPWVPEGFVFYPASDASTNGWGLPIQQIEVDDVPEDEQVFAPVNLAPGLDVTRWTPGGALGEVLVTRKPDAGYPPLSTETRQSVTYPPLYHPEFGPHPTSKTPQQYGDWQAYRLEFIDFDANAENLSPEQRVERKAWKREIFRLFNEHRGSIGLDPLYPPIRGDYDSAQATCEWAVSTRWMGHSCAGFPPTWRDVDDRSLKNGAQARNDAPVSDWTMGVFNPAPSGMTSAGEILTATASEFEVQYQDETGFDVYISNGLLARSPQQAFDAWMGSPQHAAIIESTTYDHRPMSGAWVQAGYASGVSVAHFTNRRQWVQAGNAYWHSAHTEVPTLSWFGFTSKNLYDDTWPVAFSLEGTVGASLRTVVAVQDELLNAPDGDGYGWPRWHQRLHTPSDDSEGPLRQGVLGSYIFARGRCIAIAPDSGYVLAAAIQKRGDHDVQYRLVAICLHKADDPGDVWQGFTPKVRVWWIDLPPHVLATFNGVPTSVIAGNPHTVIRTKYGAEPTEWPWIDANSPYSWRGGNVVDVSSSGLGRPDGDLLSYASMWEFNAEGTKAVCLRYSYDKTLFDWHTTTEDPLSEVPFSWANEVIGSGQVIGLSARSYIGQAVATGGIEEFRRITGTPVFCELTLVFSSDNALLANTTFWTHNPAGGFVPSEPLSDAQMHASHWYIAETPTMYVQAQFGSVPFIDADFLWLWPMRVTPIVAFYGADGSVRAVYDVESNMRSAFVEHTTLDPATNYGQTLDFNGNGLSPGVFYRGIAVGASVVDDAACRDILAAATLYSAEIGHAGINTMADWPIVLNASDDHVVFAAIGVDAPLSTSTPAPTGFPFNPAPFANLYAGQQIDVLPNPDWAPWDSVETERACVQMDVWHNGTRVHSSRHPNPNRFHVHRAWSNPWNKFTRVFWPFKGGVSFSPRMNTAWGVIGGFVVDRAGNWAMCATYGVQRGTGFFRSGSTDASYTYTNADGAQYSFRYPNSSTVFNTSGPYNLGGFMSASFATQEELAEMMQIPGANPRAHYVRIV